MGLGGDDVLIGGNGGRRPLRRRRRRHGSPAATGDDVLLGGFGDDVARRRQRRRPPRRRPGRRHPRAGPGRRSGRGGGRRVLTDSEPTNLARRPARTPTGPCRSASRAPRVTRMTTTPTAEDTREPARHSASSPADPPAHAREVLTWDDFGRSARDLAQAVVGTGYVPDVVVAIARGGLLPGGALAYALGVKAVGTLNVEFYTDVDARLPDPVVLPPLLDTAALAGRRALVVDDVADTGETLALVVRLLRRTAPRCGPRCSTPSPGRSSSRTTSGGAPTGGSPSRGPPSRRSSRPPDAGTRPRRAPAPRATHSAAMAHDVELAACRLARSPPRGDPRAPTRAAGRRTAHHAPPAGRSLRSAAQPAVSRSRSSATCAVIAGGTRSPKPAQPLLGGVGLGEPRLGVDAGTARRPRPADRSRPSRSSAPSAGSSPTGDGVAPTVPSTRRRSHARTREFSPKPGPQVARRRRPCGTS